ncbi:hypothetical protein SporoP37_01085 [Sporosarcina sp. P37]|uniref:DUF1659 domain-containing protein n=1 Tax=unclassified Sporosarcina TaxID=2647733 RepID=UPI0009BF16A0|nr:MULTISPECIES: DUF1659 domain-containing protein [unclassified Sporosarcina]ARD46897.1 hypothetical protein SporoP33_00685 [Sporosarcina sp. P33]ARK23422.1 hypothetical protein SporoP37_01085 [Sporosarcina sp. P37]PID18632.1 DUF1659 domain-containing protein [Sporosarcina sp. P35]
MAAALEFKQAVGKIHFNAGVNEKGNFIRKVKTYRFVHNGATPANLYTAFTTLSSLSSYQTIQFEKVLTEDLHN